MVIVIALPPWEGAITCGNRAVGYRYCAFTISVHNVEKILQSTISIIFHGRPGENKVVFIQSGHAGKARTSQVVNI